MKHTAAAHVKSIQSALPPQVLCDMEVNLHQSDLLSQASKHSVAVPLQDCNRKLVAAIHAHPAPIVTNNTVDVPSCTVLANLTQTIELLDHQKSMQHAAQNGVGDSTPKLDDAAQNTIAVIAPEFCDAAQNAVGIRSPEFDPGLVATLGITASRGVQARSTRD